MERIGSIWTMIVRYLLLVMFGGVIVWACNSWHDILHVQMMQSVPKCSSSPMLLHSTSAY